MRVALMNTYEQEGGAARACQRLFSGLTAAAFDAVMILREQAEHSLGGITVGSRLDGRLRALLDGLPLHRYADREIHNFSPAWMPARGVQELLRRHPDLVHLHWVVQGFVQIEALAAVACPVVWTLHDSWPFTGGCHLPGDCRRYEERCGRCPALGSRKERDWSRRIWQRKHDAWGQLSLTVVTPSRWLADRARSSSLFAHRRVEIIPNGVDTDLFRPGDRSAARRQLGLPGGGRLILFGANHAMSDSNKGFDLLRQALPLLAASERQTTELVIIGEDRDRPVPDCGLPARNLGTVTEETRLVQLFQAADLFVLPSRQENLPNMVMEAMACGIPCVGFAVGGIPELIRPGGTGYLARPYEVEDLARGVGQLLSDEATRLAMGAASREWIERHASIGRVVERYQELYQELAATDGHVQ